MHNHLQCVDFLAKSYQHTLDINLDLSMENNHSHLLLGIGYLDLKAFTLLLARASGAWDVLRDLPVSYQTFQSFQQQLVLCGV